MVGRVSCGVKCVERRAKTAPMGTYDVVKVVDLETSNRSANTQH